MVTDQETIRQLNLIRTQPQFVEKLNDDGSANLLKPALIPRETGLYRVAGTTVLKAGHKLESVFVVDTDSGAEQCNVYWYHKGVYYEHRDAGELARTLGISEEDVFPYSWTYHVPIEGDVFG